MGQKEDDATAQAAKQQRDDEIRRGADQLQTVQREREQ